jgi:hypothetical protein
MARTTIDQLLGDARRRLDRLDPLATLDAIRAGATLIDIRSDSHIAQDGVIRGIPVKPCCKNSASPRDRPRWRLPSLACSRTANTTSQRTQMNTVVGHP